MAQKLNSTIELIVIQTALIDDVIEFYHGIYLKYTGNDEITWPKILHSEHDLEFEIILGMVPCVFDIKSKEDSR